MKSVNAILTCAVLILFMNCAMGLPNFITIDASNVKNSPFRVNLEAHGKMHRIVIHAKLDDGTHPRFLGAILSVADTNGVVCSCPVAFEQDHQNAGENANSVSFKFEILTNYINFSTFQLSFQENMNMPALRIYTINLKDFAKDQIL